MLENKANRLVIPERTDCWSFRKNPTNNHHEPILLYVLPIVIFLLLAGLSGSALRAGCPDDRPADGGRGDHQGLFDARLEDAEKVTIPPAALETDTSRNDSPIMWSKVPKLEYDPPRLRPLAFKREYCRTSTKGFVKAGYWRSRSPGSGGIRIQYEDQFDAHIGFLHHSAESKKLENQRFAHGLPAGWQCIFRINSVSTARSDLIRTSYPSTVMTIPTLLSMNPPRNSVAVQPGFLWRPGLQYQTEQPGCRLPGGSRFLLPDRRLFDCQNRSSSPPVTDQVVCRFPSPEGRDRQPTDRLFQIPFPRT